MKILKTIILGVATLGTLAITPAAQAYDSHRHHWDSHRHYGSYHSHGRVVIYSSPRYYSHRPYYYDDYYDYGYSPRYSYYPRAYYSGPSISFGFGGHGWGGHSHHR